MNLIGTFEGWVPAPTDLYYMGVNSANITISAYAKFENTQITWTGSYIYFTLVINKNYNVQSFSHLNLSGNFVIKANTTGEFSVQNESGTKLSTITCGNGATLVSINITQLTSLNSGWKIYVYGSISGFYINHIWLS